MIINGSVTETGTYSDAVMLGDGVFETLRSYKNQIFALDKHLNRLVIGSQTIGIEGFDIDLIRTGIDLILEREPQESGALRISLYSDLTWVISHQPYQPPSAGIACTVITSEVSKRDYKSSSYSDRLAYRRRAIELGFDDALIANPAGLVSELSTSNLLVHLKGHWITPDLAAGALAGVTRSLLLENFGVEEANVTLAEIDQADSLAAVSSLREIQEIQRIDGKDLPTTKALNLLQDSFHSWILGNLAS